MRVLIFGGSGMLGHKLYQTLASRHETWVTLRAGVDAVHRYGIFDESHVVSGVSSDSVASVVRAVESVGPDVMVNCIGVVKQVSAGHDPVACITVNSLLPHHLARLARESRCRLIHVSTDCVFSGRKGNYTEDDIADAEDLYGRTKLLGEVAGCGCLTLRTSLIGRELHTRHGLLEWFLSQSGPRVRGYRQAVFSGFSTAAFSAILARVIEDFPGMEGVWHVASTPIRKYDLLMLIRDEYRLPLAVEPTDDVVCDRSLDGRRFREITGIAAPSWPEMIEAIRRDPTSYARIASGRNPTADGGEGGASC
jgi:dTDP-4-dehydrorhamnose reductase